MMRCSEDIRWWLHSPMDLYGRTCVEEEYEETMTHSTEAISGDVSLGRMVGVFSWCIIAWSTYSGQHQCWASYMLFFGFYDIRIYVYYVFKSICIIKGTLMVSNFVLTRRCQRRFSTSPWVLKKRLIHRQYCFTVIWLDDLICLYIYMIWMVLITWFQLPRRSTLICLLILSLSM